MADRGEVRDARCDAVVWLKQEERRMLMLAIGDKGSELRSPAMFTEDRSGMVM